MTQEVPWMVADGRGRCDGNLCARKAAGGSAAVCRAAGLSEAEVMQMRHGLRGFAVLLLRL